MANDAGTIQTGIVGAGQPSIATNQQLPAVLKSERLRLAALCDLHPGVHDYAARHGVKGYTDYAQLLADPGVALVQIATPDWCHCGQAEQALAAGKHVLLQKPPCLNDGELKRLIAAARASRGSLKVLLNSRATRLSRTLKKHLAAGVIGAPREIHYAYRGRRFPIDPPASPYLKAESGGVWLHNALHWLDEAFYFSDALPTAVQVFAARNDQGEARFLGEGPNYWSAMFPMGPGVTFNFEYNTMLLRDGMPGGVRRTLVGTEGELRQDYGSCAVTLYRCGREPEVLAPVDAELSPEEDIIESFRIPMDAYAVQILSGVEQAPRLQETLALMNALLKGMESWTTREAVCLEEFHANL